MGNFRQNFIAYDNAIGRATGDDALLDGVAVQGKFDAPWLQPDIGTLRTGIREPLFTAPDAVVAAAVKGSVLTFDGKDYVVVNPEPLGNGMTTLVLRAQA